MKKTMFQFVILSLISIGITVAACQTSAALADKADGDWSGTPVRFSKKSDVNGSFTPIFKFQRDPSSDGGTVLLSAQVSVMLPVNAPIDSLGTTAVSATAAGIATVRGTWMAHDGDEIKLHFDPATIVVNVDPDVQFELANIWTAADVPTQRTATEAMKRAFATEMTKGMEWAVSRLDEIDDVTISGNTLTGKYFKQHVTLTRVLN